MDIKPTIPCPICADPILIKKVNMPVGDVVRVFAEPLTSDDHVVAFHRHQINDLTAARMH